MSMFCTYYFVFIKMRLLQSSIFSGMAFHWFLFPIRMVLDLVSIPSLVSIRFNYLSNRTDGHPMELVLVSIFFFFQFRFFFIRYGLFGFGFVFVFGLGFFFGFVFDFFFFRFRFFFFFRERSERVNFVF
jgi:hypothetical protein